MESYDYTLNTDTNTQSGLAADGMYLRPKMGDKVLIPIDVNGTVHMAIGVVLRYGNPVLVAPIKWAFSESPDTLTGICTLILSSSPDSSATTVTYRGRMRVPGAWITAGVTVSGITYADVMKYLVAPYYYAGSYTRQYTTWAPPVSCPGAVANALQIETLQFYPIYQNLHFMNYTGYTNPVDIITPIAAHISDDYAFNLLLVRSEPLLDIEAMTISTTSQGLSFINFEDTTTNSIATYKIYYLQSLSITTVTPDSKFTWSGETLLPSITN